MVKIVIGILVMEYAVNLFLIMLGYRTGGIAPVVADDQVNTAANKVAAAFINASVISAYYFNLYQNLRKIRHLRHH